MYGLRTVMPFVIGISGLDPKRFVFLDFIGASLWALTFGLAGKFIGNVMGLIFEDVREHELSIAIGIVLTGVAVWLYRYYANRTEKGVQYE